MGNRTEEVGEDREAVGKDKFIIGGLTGFFLNESGFTHIERKTVSVNSESQKP
jgi:hypothetical protein